MIDLSPRERIILAIDTSDKKDADRLATIAHEAGARFVKLGLELQSATSWGYCSSLALAHGLDWVADAKLNDIPNTVEKAVGNITSVAHPPFGITIHTLSGVEAMTRAQKRAETAIMLGVTVLTSISGEESRRLFRASPSHQVDLLADDAVRAGILGLVCSPQEVGSIKQDPYTKKLFTMIPGTRSEGIRNDDQARVATPFQAIKDGADLLVIGRQITGSSNPAGAFESVVEEISSAL